MATVAPKPLGQNARVNSLPTLKRAIAELVQIDDDTARLKAECNEKVVATASKYAAMMVTADGVSYKDRRQRLYAPFAIANVAEAVR